MTTKIFIGIPTVDGRIMADLMLIILDWSQKYPGISINYQPFTIPHDTARNILAKRFLESNCTHFLGVDADVIPPKDTIDKLLRADKDVITTITHRFNATKTGHEVTPTTFVFNNDQYDVTYNYTVDPLMKIDGCGAGCYMAKRKVFESIERPFQFIHNTDGTIRRSEDLFFCDQLRDHKFELWADYSVVCKHIKQVDVSLLK
jgi:hypothetical protein